MNRILCGSVDTDGEEWVISDLRDWWTNEPAAEWVGGHRIPKMPDSKDVYLLGFEEKEGLLYPIAKFSGLPNTGFETVAHLRWMLDPDHKSTEYVKHYLESLSWLPVEHFDRVCRLAYVAP